MASAISRNTYCCFIRRSLLFYSQHHSKLIKASSPYIQRFHGVPDIPPFGANPDPAIPSVSYLGYGTQSCTVIQRCLCNSTTVNPENIAPKKPVESNHEESEKSGESQRTGETGKPVRLFGAG
nr:TPA_asm: hypothetical protein HUJ06_029514 [Nelumbo nucifera]